MIDLAKRLPRIASRLSRDAAHVCAQPLRRPFAMTMALVTVAFILLNLPYWWLGRTEFLSRAWFNVDLLLPVLVAPFYPALSGLMLVLLWALDLAVSEALAWNFHSPVEFIRSIEFLPMLDVTTYMSLASVLRVFAFVACGIGALWIARRAQNVGRSVGALLALVAVVDILNGSSFIWTAAQRPLPGNVAGSAAKMVATSLMSQGSEAIRPLPEKVSLTSQFDVLDYARQHPDRGILLVVVESMGSHENAAMRQSLIDHLFDARLSERFQLRQFMVPFRGSTVSGELRELCGVEGTYRSLSDAHPRCLPHKLAAMGWTTTGLHGFSYRMFMRKDWWMETGLQSARFGEDLALSDQTLCGGAFVGICDADLMRRAVFEAKEPKHFVYALTLNSHLPLNATTPDLATQRICTAAKVGADVCALTTVVDTALSALMDALAKTARPPLVLVVGDHAPPFGARASRKQYSQTAVPGIVLIPRL